MKYFIDTQFIESTPLKRLLLKPMSDVKSTIDLISLAIVSEDDREYYAISKDFDLNIAWNIYQIEKELKHPTGRFDIEEDVIEKKVYWIRDTILKTIWEKLVYEYIHDDSETCNTETFSFNYNSLSNLLEIYGKTNDEIAKEVKELCGDYPQFYNYDVGTDKLSFDWLFKHINHYPKGFPTYCRDLKQNIENIERKLKSQSNTGKTTLEVARWNRELYDLINF